MHKIMKRREAAQQGLSKYYTGVVCRKGHDTFRWTASGACVQCAAEYAGHYVRKMRRGLADRMRGHFSYPCHPDDQAAALAYCQALDLARGRQPVTPVAPSAPKPFDRWAEMERIHGRVVARQMREQEEAGA